MNNGNPKQKRAVENKGRAGNPMEGKLLLGCYKSKERMEKLVERAVAGSLTKGDRLREKGDLFPAVEHLFLGGSKQPAASAVTVLAKQNRENPHSLLFPPLL